MNVKEEQGYAALVAIMVMLVLTIIGTNLLGVVMTSLNQVRKTETRGEAEYFARMGMDEALVRLSAAIDEANAVVKASSNPPFAMVQDELEKKIKAHFIGFDKTVNDSSGNPTDWKTFKNDATNDRVLVTTSGNHGSYQILIKRDPIQKPISEDQPYVEKFTIRVIGRSSSLVEEPRTLEAVTYVNTYPEVFRYVLSTPGSIHMNGSPYVEGDTFASSYYLHNYANYYLGESFVKRTAESQYPAVVGQVSIPYDGSNADKESIKSSRFFWKPPSSSSYSAFDPNIKSLASSQWYQVFTLAPTINLTEKPAFNGTSATSDIPDIPTLVSDRKPSLPADHKKILDTNPGDPLILPITCDGCNNNLYIEDSVKINAGTTVEMPKDLFIEGSLLMENRANSTPTLTVNGNLYVDGENDPTLTAATLSGEVKMPVKDSFIYINGNAVFDRLTMTKGKVFVNGNLKIQGNFKMNATVFVKGDVQFTEDDGTSDLAPEGNTLVILSGGKVEAYNLNLYKDDPTKLYTFIYSQHVEPSAPDLSETGIVLYGVGSNYQIIGGIHSKQNISLNSIKGKISVDNIGSGSFVDTSDLKPETARLSVIFNQDLYNNPPPGIPSALRANLKIIQFELDSFQPNDPTGVSVSP